MKKHDYNQFTKSDIPLDSPFSSSLNQTEYYTSAQQIKKKSSISVIGKNAQNKANFSNQKEFSNNKIAAKDIKNKELESLNDEGIKSYRSRARRNRTIIILLIFLLSIVLSGFGLFFIFTDAKSNCFINIHGNYNTTTYVNDLQLTQFVSPAAIKGNRTFEFDADLVINEEGEFNVSYEVKCYQNTTLMRNTQVLKSNNNFVYNGATKRYESKVAVNGYDRIDLLEAVLLDFAYEDTLNLFNFKMYIDVYITAK